MIVKTSRTKAAMVFLGCVGAAWLSHYYANGGADWINGRSAGKLQFAFYLFAVLSPLAFFKMLSSGRTIAKVEASGLYAPRVTNALIPWRDIGNMGVVRKAGNETIVFDLVPGSPSESAVSTSATISKAVGSAVNVNGYQINLAMTGVSADQFTAAVATAMHTPSAPSYAVPTSPAQPTHNSGPARNNAARFGKRGTA